MEKVYAVWHLEPHYAHLQGVYSTLEDLKADVLDRFGKELEWQAADGLPGEWAWHDEYQKSTIRWAELPLNEWHNYS